MLTRCRVLIVDDQIQTREGLKALLSTVPPVQVVGEAADGREAMHLIDVRQPDVVLMDRFVVRFIQAGQTGRLRELAERHAKPAVRSALAAMLPPAEPKEQAASR